MIDWFSGFVGYDASQMVLGRVVKTNRRREILFDRDAWETERGSYDSGVQVTRCVPTTTMLEHSRTMGFLCSPVALQMSGNPSKFLQGHNAAGPSVSQLGPLLQAMVRAFSEGIRPLDADSPTLPAVHRSRVDVTTAIDLASHEAVHEWLQLAEMKTRSRHGRAQNSEGTVYWGKHSTRWSMKAYCKHCELKVHPPDDQCPPGLFADLLEWTRPHLRLELTLRRPELKDRGTLTEAIIWEFFSKLEVHSMKVRDYASLKLSRPSRTSMQLWYDGHDLKMVVSTKTLYRHRKEILAETGIDVLLPRSEQQSSAAPVLLGLDELRAREVHDAPERIQMSLFGARC